MGRFTGKSDFEDMVLMHYSPSEILKGTVIMNGAVLKLETERDLIPLYPYLTSMMSASKQEDGSSKIFIELCNTSYIDTTEERWKQNLVKDLVYICKNSKKKPTELTFDDIKDYYSDNHIFSDETLKKAIDIVSKGESAFAFNIVCSVFKIKKNHNFVDSIIRTYSKEYFYSLRTLQAIRQRKELLKFASENGWSKKYDCSDVGNDMKSMMNHSSLFVNEPEKDTNTLLNRMMFRITEN